MEQRLVSDWVLRHAEDAETKWFNIQHLASIDVGEPVTSTAHQNAVVSPWTAGAFAKLVVWRWLAVLC
jgi:hypothetical protein